MSSAPGNSRGLVLDATTIGTVSMQERVILAGFGNARRRPHGVEFGATNLHAGLLTLRHFFPPTALPPRYWGAADYGAIKSMHAQFAAAAAADNLERKGAMPPGKGRLTFLRLCRFRIGWPYEAGVKYIGEAEAYSISLMRTGTGGNHPNWAGLVKLAIEPDTVGKPTQCLLGRVC